ncbi:MAG TPA: DUF481 domain-containing protein [Acidobacteria bacterium]|nr:DUF481 domain-containing protein [Acidobacteriota bacterium]
MAWDSLGARDGRGWLIVTLIVTIALLAGGTVRAADDGGGSWHPAPPMPDDADWVELTSGEWLKGEIISMYEDSLRFDSDKLDELDIDWDDVKEIRTAGTMQVGLENRTVVSGRLLLVDGTVRLLGTNPVEVPKSAVLSITAGEPKERNYWSGELSAGFNRRSGNTDQTETSGHVKVQRRTPKTRLTMNYLGNFTQTDGQTTSDNQQATLDWNWFLSHRFYLTPVTTEYYRDPFQNIANRWTLGFGAGYQLLDTSKVTWNVDLGFAYQRTRFVTVQPPDSGTANTPTLRVGTRYDNELTGWLDFFLDYRFFVVNKDSGSFNHRFQTGLEIDLIGDLTLNFTWVWDYLKDPRAGSDGIVPKSDDFRTIFGIGYSF